MIVTVLVTVPPALLAVIVYVAVTEGETVVELEAATAPIPLSIETLVAPVVVQDRVEDWPTRIVVGLAVKLTVGGRGVTVSVAVLVIVPPGPIAVSV